EVARKAATILKERFGKGDGHKYITNLFNI
ncbi:unnamed protein product, partial [marine sediment metagenome]